MSNNKETYYFSHDSNARNDEKLIAVRMKHGAEGYGIYFMIVERLLEATNYMSVKDYNIIAFDLRVSAEKVKSIIEDFGLFEFLDDGKKFTSKSLIRRMKPLDNLREQRQNAGKKSAEKRKLNKIEKRKLNKIENQEDSNDRSTTVQRPLCENPTKESKVKESKVKESRECKRAHEFLKLNFPIRYEQEFEILYSKKIHNLEKFYLDFHDKVEVEKRTWDGTLMNRLGSFARNWIEVQDKHKKNGNTPRQNFKTGMFNPNRNPK